MRLDPLAGQPLGLGDLFTSHPLLDFVLVAPRSLVSLGRGEIVPHIGEDIVLGDTVTIVVQQSKVGLGTSIPLLGG